MSGRQNAGNAVVNVVYQVDKRSYTQVTNNMKSIGKSIGGVGKALKGVTKILVGAFAVKKLVDFGKESINLASDLQEVQNVVDETFGKMASDVNEFAKSTIKNVGLSELSAKKYTSTLGAMLKSSGLTTDQALKMSKSMTALAGDMASFYNLKGDDAFNKIRAGISGETEPLKQLGINMSVANMEAFALSKGITKSYNAMSQAEQTLLRYNYLLSVTKDAQGDFARTTDSWANQVSLLKENFNSLKGILGQGFLVALTPVVKVLNTIVVGLQMVAGYATSFMKSIFGIKDVGESVKGVSSGISTVGESASSSLEGVADGFRDVGKEAKKAQGSVARFDDLIQLSKPSDTASSGGGGVDFGGVSMDIPEYDFSKWGNETPDFAGLTEKFKNFSLDVNSFLNSIGIDTSTIGSITASFSSIGSQLQNLFKGMQPTLMSFGTTWLGYIKDMTVSTVNLGLGIADGLVGGISKYLDQNGGRLQESVTKIVNDLGSSMESVQSIFGDVSGMIADFFKLDTTKQAIADFVAIMSDLILKPKELIGMYVADALGALDTIITANKDKMVLALTNLSEAASEYFGLIKTAVQDTFDSILSAYNTYFKPAIDNIAEAVSMIVGKVLDAFNNYIKPTFSELIAEFSRVYETAIKPFVDKLMEVVGKLVYLGSVIYKNFIAPIIGWLVDLLGPAFSRVFSNVGRAVATCFQAIAEVGKGLLTALGGIIDFLIGVFTGDWSKAWGGVKDIFGGIWESLKGLMKAPINWIIDGINSFIKGLNKIQIPDWVPVVGGKGLNIAQIPKLANGGIVNGQTTFIAGEAGAEAIIPLENSSFIDSFARKIASIIGSGQGGQTVNLYFNIENAFGDDQSMRELARKIKSYLQQEGVRTGGVSYGF